MNNTIQQLLNFSLFHDFQKDVLRIFEYVYADRREEAEAQTLFLVQELLEWGYTPVKDDLTLECEIMHMFVEYFNSAFVSWLQITNRPVYKYTYEVEGNALLSCCQFPDEMKAILGQAWDYLLGGNPDGFDRRSSTYDAIEEYNKKIVIDLTLEYKHIRDIHLNAERDDLTPLFQEGYKVGLPMKQGHPTNEKQLFDDLYGLYKPVDNVRNDK